MTSSDSKNTKDSKKEPDTTDSLVERELGDAVDDITLNSGSYTFDPNDEDAVSNNESKQFISTNHTDSEIQNNETELTTMSEPPTINFTRDVYSESTAVSSSTLDFTPMILKSVHNDDDNLGVLLDKEKNPVTELGFEENIILPRDFESTDVRLMVDRNGFCLFSDKENLKDSETKTSSYHQMKYTRIFDRPIRNVDMECIQGKIIVYGEFDDYDYPQ